MSGAPIAILLWLIFLGTMWCIREVRGTNE